MAQRTTGKNWVANLAKRYGIAADKRLVSAVILVATVLALLGLARLAGPSGFAIERASAAADETMGAVDGLDDDEEQGVSEGQAHGSRQAEALNGNVVLVEERDAEPEVETKPVLVVHVDGAVTSPGVFRLEGDDLRLIDAVEAAGGLLEDADTTKVNLAAALEDGTKVHVPHVGEELALDAAGAAPAETETTQDETASADAELVNINTAGLEELQKLTGVGEATARAIIEERETNGPFAAPEDLMRVSGIGEKKFAKMRDQVCV